MDVQIVGTYLALRLVQSHQVVLCSKTNAAKAIEVEELSDPGPNGTVGEVPYNSQLFFLPGVMERLGGQGLIKGSIRASPLSPQPPLRVHDCESQLDMSCKYYRRPPLRGVEHSSNGRT